MERSPHIGVIGSAKSGELATQNLATAQEIGRLLALERAVLLFGAEKDCNTLPTIAALKARELGGLTVGITYGSSQQIHRPESASVIIASGLERGGGREAALCFSSEAIISISGGAGTLAELAIAYQYKKPLICLEGSGGWSDTLANQYLDDRERVLLIGASTPDEAVTKALDLATKYRNQ